MKSHLFPVLLLFSTVCPAQSSFPFPTDHAEWIVYKVFPVLGPNDDFEVYRDYLNGDTVFLGKTYSKAYRQNLCICICSSPSNYEPASNSQPYLLGGVREEAGKVYFTRFGSDGQSYFNPVVDTLLFDFTAQVGDTIPYADNTKLFITSIDTELDGRKKIHFEIVPPHYPAYWLEGIGSRGLLETNGWYNADFNHAACFSDTTPFDCPIPCDVSVKTETPDDPTTLNIVPALATDYVRIEGNEEGALSLRVFSAEGQLLDSRRELHCGDRVGIEHLPAGLLLFRLETRQGVAKTIRVIRN